ncbi:hypothetical protein OH809_37300 [Streptomyces sp. NBC_00873]|uniref:hypothetical protein n=1 Tax=unclassified Streptomyces TaxID=2593676 RepID=UPI003863E8D0|nr:hypothetical protein OH809_37300 [Streptomyces sp. NBC_00873]WTA42289.1 hypothetical protein OH821_06410 [Streptomyces sp. NBC_00842]
MSRRAAAAAALLLVAEAAFVAGGTAVAATPEPKSAPAKAQQRAVKAHRERRT